ncbi:MAG: DUF429 domain-containing protein [Nocardioides sp.]
MPESKGRPAARPARRGRTAPARPVLGADGCRAGWIGALLLPGELQPAVGVRSTLHDLMAWAESAAGGEAVATIAVDMPMGLPEFSIRQAEGLARALLPGRGSTVFPVLSRAAYCAPDRIEADRINRALTGRGVGIQAFSLAPKILEVDAWRRTVARHAVVLEAHPELAFATMAGGPVPTKHKGEGIAVRRELLAGVGIDAPEKAPRGATLDDLVDACAVAWVARRFVAGEARSLPDPPERFSDGYDAAIWV